MKTNLAATWILVGFFVGGMSPAAAQDGCTTGAPIVPEPQPPPYPILSPGDSGANGQSRLQNLLTLLDDLELAGSTRVLTIDGAEHQLPPWFDPARIQMQTPECTEPWLHRGPGNLIPAPTLDPPNYLVVSDELSELAFLTSMGVDPVRMARLDRSIQKMVIESGPFEGLPCWLAHVNGTAFDCHPSFLDSATDATVRLGLAYYLAARNLEFPAVDRDLYLTRANSLAALHLDLEYRHFAPPCPFNPATGNELCHFVAGGANAAASGIMYTGYYQDVIRLLLAAFAATGDPSYLERATEVVEQYLLASQFNGTDLSFGRKCFQWGFSMNPPEPMVVNVDDCPFWWDQNRAWDVDDAPRALWMGDVLRAHHLVTDAAPLPAAYQQLRDWLELVLTSTSPVGQTDSCSCIQYNQDGTVVSGNCHSGHYPNGLGLGLLMHVAAGAVETKLDTAMSHYLWDLKRWDDQGTAPPGGPNVGCFFIFRGVRTVKALAAAIGLDEAIYSTGQVFYDGFESGDTSAWTATAP